jgi:V/A-type H+/Na+-transporting ATPase subunit D
MAELTPTRSLVIALADERRTMREGYAFLDEKCLLLAGEMLQAVRAYRAQQRELRRRSAEARRALHAAIARHGLGGLQTYPATPLMAPVATGRRSLLGVAMQSARADVPADAGPTLDAINPSPEADACRRAHAALLPLLAELAALSGNLARLYFEYRRTVRRVRALQDVLLPEIEQTLADIETRLEELEQDEAAVLRRAAQAGGSLGVR